MTLVRRHAIVAELRPIVITDYDPAWPARYEIERVRLCEVFAPALVAIDHIGSTSVVGMRAKPLIDILVVLREAAQLSRFDAAMHRLGYVARGAHGIAGRAYFSKDTNGVRTHHVHVFASGHPAIARHLAFRNYLAAHSDVAREYERVKASAAVACANDRKGYEAAKAPFITRVLDVAMSQAGE